MGGPGRQVMALEHLQEYFAPTLMTFWGGKECERRKGGLFSVPLKGIVVFVSWQPSLVPNQPIHTFWLETEVWGEGAL